MKKLILPLLLLSSTAFAQSKLRPSIDQQAAAIENKVIDWRRDIHQHPELGNEETRTAKKVADHLRALGIEVQEGDDPADISIIRRVDINDILLVSDEQPADHDM